LATKQSFEKTAELLFVIDDQYGGHGRKKFGNSSDEGSWRKDDDVFLGKSWERD
jgi:hypothetical protein